MLLLYILMGSVTCVMLSATVPGHNAMFLSLLFQTERLSTSDRGEVSCVHPVMILAWSEYPRESMYRHVRGAFPISTSSWDHTEDVLYSNLGHP